jgi:uncharacterized protein (DUF2384 family)
MDGIAWQQFLELRHPHLPLARRAPRAHLAGMPGRSSPYPTAKYDRIVEMLADFYTPDEIMEWLAAPHPQLGGRSALGMMADDRADEVIAVIERLRDCVYI